MNLNFFGFIINPLYFIIIDYMKFIFIPIKVKNFKLIHFLNFTILLIDYLPSIKLILCYAQFQFFTVLNYLFYDHL